MSENATRDYHEIEAELKKRVEGDIHFDRTSRLLYSTDASIYQIEPIGVVVPRHKGDVQSVIDLANKLNVPVLPRGGGTSLAGQTVGHAIVLDFSKYMQNVLEVNKEELWCRVQPGLVQDELNAHVRPMGLQFGPDTSTSNRATIGGMIGNNSAGAHSFMPPGCGTRRRLSVSSEQTAHPAVPPPGKITASPLAACRFVPPCTGWYRLVPDKIFSPQGFFPVTLTEKLWLMLRGTLYVVVCRDRAVIKIPPEV